MRSVVDEIKAFFSRPGVQDLFELTYAYTIEEDCYFNRTLFQLYTWCDQTTAPEELLRRTRAALAHDQSLLVQLEDQITVFQDRRSPIFHKTLTYAQKVRTLIRWAVPFEIQKWHLGREWTSEYAMGLHTVQQIDYELFGHLIIHDTWEVSRSYSYLQHALQKYGDALEIQERILFQDYLRYIEALPACNPTLYELLLPPSFLDDARFSVQVPRELYIRLFQLVFDFYGLKVPIVVEERGSIYDGHDALYLPASETYDTLSLAKILELITHEIEVHYIVLYNTDQVLEGIKGGRSLAREEGLAILHEYMLNGYALEDFDIRPNIPTLLMGELLAGPEYHDFLRIYRKLHGFIPRGTEYLLRRKRNYPFGEIWLLHKDVTYSRGMYYLRGRLLEYDAYADLFLAKVDMEDILCVAEHVHQEQLPVIFPKLLGMRLVGHILANKQESSLWIRKLQKKYRFISDVVLEPFSSRQQKIRQQLLDLVESITKHVPA